MTAPASRAHARHIEDVRHVRCLRRDRCWTALEVIDAMNCAKPTDAEREETRSYMKANP